MTDRRKLFLWGLAFGCLLALSALPGCAPGEPRENSGPPAPSAGITKDAALVLAREAASTINGEVRTFTTTGSMLPVLDSRTVAVFERLASTDTLHVGDIVSFPTAAGPYCHRVTAVGKDGYVITSGDNNDRGDGWQKPTHRVVAIFYTLRQ